MYNFVKHENIELRENLIKYFEDNIDKYFDSTFLAKVFDVSNDKIRFNLNYLVKKRFIEKDNFLGTTFYTYRG